MGLNRRSLLRSVRVPLRVEKGYFGTPSGDLCVFNMYDANPQREPGDYYGHVIDDKILNEVLFLRDYYSVYFFGNKLGYFTL